MIVGRMGRWGRIGVGVRIGERRVIAGETEDGMWTQCCGGGRAEVAECYVVGEVAREAGIGCCCLFAHFGDGCGEGGGWRLRGWCLYGGVLNRMGMERLNEVGIHNGIVVHQNRIDAQEFFVRIRHLEAK